MGDGKADSFSVQPRVKHTSKVSGSRRDKVVISEAEIGALCNHTWLCWHWLGCTPDGKCSCKERETAKHVLIHCRNYDRERNISRAELSERGAGHPSLKSILGTDDWGIRKKGASPSRRTALSCLNVVFYY